MKDDSARRQRVRAAAGARLEIMFNYNYNKIYNNIIITNHKYAARHDSCSGGRRTKCHRSIHFLERDCGCITFDISQPPPPSYHLYHLKLVRKLHVLFFMTLLLIVVIYFNTAQQSALHPLPVLHPALITFLLALTPTLVAL